MSKFIKMLTCAILSVGIIIPYLHVHDEQCGYDPATGEGCIYEIDPSYEYDPEDD